MQEYTRKISFKFDTVELHWLEYMENIINELIKNQSVLDWMCLLVQMVLQMHRSVLSCNVFSPPFTYIR